MDEITLFFGKRVRSIRISKKMSQEKLAELSGLHPTYIGQIERGEKSPTLESIYKISNGLDVPISNLFSNMEKRQLKDNEDYSLKIYNKIISLPDDKKEKLYKILNLILDYKI